MSIKDLVGALRHGIEEARESYRHHNRVLVHAAGKVDYVEQLTDKLVVRMTFHCAEPAMRIDLDAIGDPRNMGELSQVTHASLILYGMDFGRTT